MPARLVWQVVALLVIACSGCSEADSPANTTPTPAVRPPVEFSLSGMVQDTALRPVVDVRIEVIDGPRAGEFVMSDAAGRYAFPGVFSDGVTLEATKDGYLPATKRQQSNSQGRQFLGFSMVLSDPSADIAGDYALTITADSSCSELPDLARTRTYTAAISPWPSNTPHSYLALLSGATFFPSTFNDRFFIWVAGNYARFYLDPFDDGSNIAEELEPDTYLSIWGVAELSAMGRTISGTLDGAIAYCSGPSAGRGFYSCRTAQARCDSPHHRVMLVRR
jgi:hypothetical protein